jgi:hypothetical protein
MESHSQDRQSTPKAIMQEGLLVEISKGPFDPYKVFILAEPGRQSK